MGAKGGGEVITAPLAGLEALTPSENAAEEIDAEYFALSDDERADVEAYAHNIAACRDMDARITAALLRGK